MQLRPVRLIDIGLGVTRVARDTQVTFLAGAIAYYAFVSVIPLLLLGTAAATALGGEQLADSLVNATSDVLTPAGQELVREALTASAGRGGATVVGILVLVWGSLRGFRGVDRAFSLVYGSPKTESILEGLLDALIMLSALGIAIGLVAIAGIATPIVPGLSMGWLGVIGLFLTLVVVFLPLYRFMPDIHVSLREIIPGVILAAAGWTILGELFRLYTVIAGNYAIYGLLGGVLLFLTWLYVGSIIIMVGAALNAVLGGHAAPPPDRQLQHTGPRSSARMSGSSDDADEGPQEIGDASGVATSGEAVTEQLEEELDGIREDLEAFREDIEERTVERSTVETELERYVRQRLRRGHARGWGPYLVLLYGTAMTLGGFYYLSGGWAILAMIVVWLSTLGLYVLMLIVGAGLGALSIPGRAVELIQDRRS